MEGVQEETVNKELETKEPEIPPEVPPQPDPEVESEAMGMGWIPKESFKGNPDNWRPAEEYVKRGRELMPIMKAQMGKYETKIKNLEETISGQRNTTEKLIKMSDKIRKQEYDKAKRELTAKQMEAVQESDIEKWKSLETEKENLELPEETKIEEPAPKQQDPAYVEWESQNDWYMKDEDATLFANAQADVMKKQNPNIPYTQLLNDVSTKVKAAFPHKFKNPNRQVPASVDTTNQSGNETPATNEKSYNDLPAAAKAYCDKLEKEGLLKDSENGLTAREQYVKSYYEDEEE